MATSNRKTKKTGSATPSMRVSGRVVNGKLHTVGYVINNQHYTVRQAAQMARSGRLQGVRVVGNHIQSVGGRRLSSLPAQRQQSR